MNDKKIHYCAVCRAEAILCDFTEDIRSKSGEFTQDILSNIKPGRKVLEYDRCDYMVEKDMGDLQMTYLIVVEKGFSKQIGFEMLEKMRSRFEATVDRKLVASARAMSLIPQFRDELKTLHLLHSFNNVDKTEVAIAKMNDLREVQIESLKNIMQRESKVDSLLERADAMDRETYTAKNRASSSRKSFWWEKVWIKIFIFTVAVFLIYVAMSLYCGFDFSKCY